MTSQAIQVCLSSRSPVVWGKGKVGALESVVQASMGGKMGDPDGPRFRIIYSDKLIDLLLLILAYNRDLFSCSLPPEGRLPDYLFNSRTLPRP